MREKMGKERKKRGGKKLQKEEMAWLTQNTRFDKSNINAWHKVRILLLLMSLVWTFQP